MRPKQDRLGDTARERVIPVLVHGDAAFAGQGVVAETLNLSQLDGYSTGGTIHLIINNQIGFTTLPDESRSTPYSTDIARGVQAPIFHVNGDSPQAAIRVVQMAFDYRQQFKKDVVIDMICYRRHGHNEGDDPSYTQPILYRKIKEHPSVATLYAERLVREGVVFPDEVQEMRKAVSQRLSDAYDAVQQQAEHYEVQELSAVPSEDIGSFCPRTVGEPAGAGARDPRDDAVSRRTSTCIPSCAALSRSGATPSRKTAPSTGPSARRWLSARWRSKARAVRLSGQDSGRGTFSQRHLAFYDSETGKRYIPLQHISPDQARFDVYDSSLSEYAVLGFEFGYSVADPLTLVIWEAQFGDFANGAQIMIDQFISSARIEMGTAERPGDAAAARLRRPGAGALERAHRAVPDAVRREQYAGLQLHHAGAVFPPAAAPDVRRTRPPRHAQAAGHLHAEEPAAPSAGGLDGRTSSRPADSSRSWTTRWIRTNVTRVVFCSGKVYYDLLAAREERKAEHVALVRVEQLYPFAADAGRRYPGAVCRERRSGVGAGRAAEYGAVALHPRTDPAAARSDLARGPLRRPAGKRQPRDRVGQTPSAGAGGNCQRRA